MSLNPSRYHIILSKKHPHYARAKGGRNTPRLTGGCDDRAVRPKERTPEYSPVPAVTNNVASPATAHQHPLSGSGWLIFPEDEPPPGLRFLKKNVEKSEESGYLENNAPPSQADSEESGEVSLLQCKSIESPKANRKGSLLT